MRVRVGLIIAVLLLAVALPAFAQDQTVVPIGNIATVTIPERWVFTSTAPGVYFATDEEAQQAFANDVSGTLIISGGTLDSVSFPANSAAALIAYGADVVAVVNQYLDTQEAAGAEVVQSEMSGRPSRTLSTTSGDLGFAAGVLEDGPNSLVILMIFNSSATTDALGGALNSLEFAAPPAAESPLTTIPITDVATIDIPNTWVQVPDVQEVLFGVDLESILYFQSIIARVFGQVTGADSTPEALIQPNQFTAGFIGPMTTASATADGVDVASLIANGAISGEIDGRPAAWAVDEQYAPQLLLIGAIEDEDQTLSFWIATNTEDDLPEGGLEALVQTIRFVEPAAP